MKSTLAVFLALSMAALGESAFTIRSGVTVMATGTNYVTVTITNTVTNSIGIYQPYVMGQTSVWYAGDAGTYSSNGTPNPSPRFVIGTSTGGLGGVSATNTVYDVLTGLTWVRSPITNLYTASNAIDYCESLDGTQGRGGYTDWRLPNVNEYRSMARCQTPAPYIWNTAGTGALTEGNPFCNVSGVFNNWSYLLSSSRDWTYGNMFNWCYKINIGTTTATGNQNHYLAVRGP